MRYGTSTKVINKLIIVQFHIICVSLTLYPCTHCLLCLLYSSLIDLLYVPVICEVCSHLNVFALAVSSVWNNLSLDLWMVGASLPFRS